MKNKSKITHMTAKQKLEFFRGHKIVARYVKSDKQSGWIPVCRDEVLWHKPLSSAKQAETIGHCYIVALNQLSDSENKETRCA